MLTFAIYLVVTLIVIGFLLWIVQSAPFISADVKPIIRWVVILLCGIWLIMLMLSFFRLGGAPAWFGAPIR